MSNFVYEPGKKALLNQSISLTGSAWKAVCVSAGYTASSADANMTAASAYYVGTPQPVTLSLTDGTGANAGKVIVLSTNVTFTAVSGNQITQLVIFQDTGAAGTSVPLVHWDSGTGFPLTPNGGNVLATFDATNGICEF